MSVSIVSMECASLANSSNLLISPSGSPLVFSFAKRVASSETFWMGATNCLRINSAATVEETSASRIVDRAMLRR